MMKQVSIWLVCAAVVACGDSDNGPNHEPIPADAVSDGGDGGMTGDGGDGGMTGGGGGAGGVGSGYGGYPLTGPIVCNGTGALYVTDVVELSYGPGQDHGRDEMPDIVFGPPVGGGTSMGSLDVVSLGNGGVIGVAFADNGIVDGPGADFIVYENPFQTGENIFAELGTVEVSMDGETWDAFPCTATEAPYDDCAGHTPVSEDGDGGDAFDLEDIGVTEARYVRITDRADIGGFAGVFDLDAVGIVNAACP